MRGFDEPYGWDPLLMGGVRFNGSGHLIVVLQRRGEPGKNRPQWCEK